MGLLEKVISVVAPHSCLACGYEGSLLCPWCLPDAAHPVPSRCYRCRRVSEDSLVCKSCRRGGSRIGHVWVRSEYQGLTKELVYQLKFKRARAAAPLIAGLMEEALPWLDPAIIVVPVPTASIRRRSRGYDHAELIAKELAQLRGLNQALFLSRIGQSRQVGARRSERLTQLENAFLPRNLSAIKGARILLVDDIVTSGGTLETAARILRKAGARSVDAVAFAQKQ